MRLFAYVTGILLVYGVSADIGLHAANHRRLLQAAPSFTGDTIELHPGLHPDHDASDLKHLFPNTLHDLHWSQEGHRPALHGAKHAQMKATFNKPTVVLEHSNQIKSIECKDELMTVCFNSLEGFLTAEKTWMEYRMRTLNIITYHHGCGHTSGRKRSFFEASHMVFDPLDSCVIMPVTPVEEHDTIDSGELKWGTYIARDERRRFPVKGHVRVAAPADALADTSTDTNDITTNSTALEDFFAWEYVSGVNVTRNGTIIGTNGNTTVKVVDPPDSVTAGKDHLVDGPDFISMDGTVPEESLSKRDVEKRDLFSWIDNSMTWFTDKLFSIFQTIANTIEATANVIAKFALLAADLIAVPSGAKFERSYHNDIKAAYFRGGSTSSKPPNVDSISEGWELGDRGAEFNLTCVKCGVETEMTVDGELAFSMKEGITKGEISLEIKKAMKIHAIFGLMINVKETLKTDKLEKQLGAIPMSPIAIPGIFTLGPQISVSIAATLALEAKANLLIGGTMSISTGLARLSLVDKGRNKLKGFKPSFHPVAEATSGSIKATAELGLPIAIEAGIDVLNGKFKQTVGLVNAPSVYMSAELSSGEGKKCNNGVELRFGVKNRIYFAALSIYEYTIKTWTIYETGLTCIRPTGFSRNVEADQTVFTNTQNLPKLDSPTINNVSASLSSTVKGNEGFRIVMDEKETSILVSGTDRYVYLSQKNQGYDLSAPWGSLNITQDIVDFDVFGRLLCFNRLTAGAIPWAFPLRVCNPKKIPFGYKVVALAVLKANGRSFDTYAASIPMNIISSRDSVSLDFFYVPTACKIQKGKKNDGLRLFLTRYLITEDERIINRDGSQVWTRRPTENDLRAHGVNDLKSCRTVKLTSKIQG